MGYTGSVTLNGRTIFNEWKADGSEFCMQYSMTYNASKKTPLSIMSIDKTIGYLHGTIATYNETARAMTAALSIKRALAETLEYDSFYGKFHFDENEKKTFFIVEEHYRQYDTEHYMFKEENENASKEPNLISHFRAIDIFSMFNALETIPFKERMKRRELFESNIKNIETKMDVFKLMKELDDVFVALNDIHTYRNNFAKKTTNLLYHFRNCIKNGESVVVQYINNMLTIEIVNGEKSCINCDNFFLVSTLFEPLVTSCSSYSDIKTKDDLNAFLNSFVNVKNRNKSLENIIRDALKNVNLEKEFTLSIGGSY